MADHQSIRRILTVGARHPRPIAWLRVGVGLWLILLTAILYRSGEGGHWAWLLLAAAAAHFALAFRLFRIARRGEDRRVTFA